MIYIDASELKSSSRLRRRVDKLYPLFGFDSEDKFLSAVSVPDLESRTGADLILTKRSMPVTDAFLPQHMDDGAILVQLKFGNDLASSFGTRLHESMHRMWQITHPCHTWQRVLMFVGGIGCDRKGLLLVNGRPAIPKRGYRAFHTAVRHWNRFGVYHPEPREAHLADTLKALEEGICEPPREEFWPTPPTADDFEDEVDIMPPEPVKDWRLTIATFPGVGPKKATALKRAMEAHPGAVPELPSVLQWVTAPKEEREFMGLPKIPMWGDKTFEACREWVFGESDHSLQKEHCKLVFAYKFFDVEGKRYL